MPAITVFSGTFCNDASVVRAMQRQTQYELVSDLDLIRAASRLSSLPEHKIERALSSRISSFNKISHEREKSIAYLRLALAQMQNSDNLIFNGFVGQLIPRDVNHVLRVCLIADIKSRIAAAAEALDVPESDAAKLIHRQDEDRAAWMHMAFENADPWDASLYDMVFPTDKIPVETIVATVAQIAETSTVKRTPHSEQAINDFMLAAKVEVALIQEGHDVKVHAGSGAVTLIINKHVLMLSRLENELKSIAGRIDGVASVETEVGAGFYMDDKEIQKTRGDAT